MNDIINISLTIIPYEQNPRLTQNSLDSAIIQTKQTKTNKVYRVNMG